MICRRKISVFMCKRSVYFNACSLSDRSPVLLLLWWRHCLYLIIKFKSKNFFCFVKFLLQFICNSQYFRLKKINNNFLKITLYRLMWTRQTKQIKKITLELLTWNLNIAQLYCTSMTSHLPVDSDRVHSLRQCIISLWFERKERVSQQNLPLKLFSRFKLRYFKQHFTRSGEFCFDILLKRRLNEWHFNTSARLTSVVLVNTTLSSAMTFGVRVRNQFIATVFVFSGHPRNVFEQFLPLPSSNKRRQFFELPSKFVTIREIAEPKS